MKIAVIIATRGASRRAAAVIEAARALASGEHEIDFIVSCDNDDPGSLYRFTTYPGVRLSTGPRPPGVAECWNRCLRLTDADFVTMLADDGFVATPHWDACIAMLAEEGRFPRELTAFAWHDTANPGQPTVLGASREWVALIGGKMLDDRFPFWFADTAFAETWSFVTGEYLPILPIVIASKPGRFNPRLRDMGFWWDFYVATRRERIETAARIRADLGLSLSPSRLAEVIASWEARDALGRPGAIEAAAELPPRKPDPAYLRALESARIYMEAA